MESEIITQIKQGGIIVSLIFLAISPFVTRYIIRLHKTLDDVRKDHLVEITNLITGHQEKLIAYQQTHQTDLLALHRETQTELTALLERTLEAIAQDTAVMGALQENWGLKTQITFLQESIKQLGKNL